MTPEEEKEYIDEINDKFCYFIDVAPFVEIGEVSGMQRVKLRAHAYEGYYSVGEIIFELQMKLHLYKINNPDKNIEKLIVSELELTPGIYSPTGFCPIRGLMISMKYI